MVSYSHMVDNERPNYNGLEIKSTRLIEALLEIKELKKEIEELKKQLTNSAKICNHPSTCGIYPSAIYQYNVCGKYYT